MNVYELFAKISLDDSEYNSKLGKAGSAMKTVAKTIGNGLATVAKVGAAAVAAGATALTALGTASVKSYAEYEQLVGGVETLFKESANTVKGYAEEAYKTAGLSANDYMNTVTSFSASLISSLGGDTAKAAEYANMAISDMADNANKMGTSIEMIQNAYQGFAKQNYTMLDNLKLGYGGTKTEMQRLLKDATAIQKKNGKLVKYTIDDFGDIVEAIHVIQEEMGIYGTTAAEAEKTIAGSINAMKAAWQNLVTAFSDPNMDLGKYMDRFLESVTTVGNNIIPRIQMLLPRLVEGITTLVSTLGPQIVPIIEDLLPSLIQGAVSLIANLVSILPSLVVTIATSVRDAIYNAFGVTDFSGLLNILTEKISSINWQQVGNNVANFLASIDWTSAVDAVFEALGAAFGALGGFLVGIFQSAWNAVTDYFGEWISAAEDAGLGVAEGILAGIISGIGDIVSWMYANIFEPFIGGFVSACGDMISNAFIVMSEAITVGMMAIGEIISAAAEIITLPFQFMWENCKGIVSQALSAIQEIVSSVLSAISEKFGSDFEQIRSTVSQKIENVRSDISSKLESAKATVSSVLENIKDKFQSIFDNAKNIVKTAIDTIRGYFNFSWSLPKIKLPHFSISGSFSLNPPSVPRFSISWYKKAMDNAMILNGATIFGMMGNKFLGGGEAGSEVVAGADTLMDMIREAVSTTRGHAPAGQVQKFLSPVFNITVNGTKYDDLSTLARDLMYEIQVEYDRSGLTYA